MFYKLVDLSLSAEDINFLGYLKDKYIDNTIPIQGKNSDGTIRPVFYNYRNFFLRDSSTNYSENELFKKIAFLCRNTPEHWDYKYVYKRFHLAYIPGTLPYHTDMRECVLTIPYGKIDYPISWIDEAHKIIEYHHYKGPVLVNTKVQHGCPENQGHRIMFQIGFNQSFDTISQLI